MNIVDLAILSLLTIGALYGLVRGAVRPLIGILALVVAFIWARSLGDHFAPWLTKTFSLSEFMGQRLAAYGAGLAIYLAVRFVGSWVETYFVEKITAFKVFNRLGGSVLGAMFVGLFVASVLAFLAFLPQSPVKKHLGVVWASRSYQYVRDYNPFMHPTALEQLRGLRGVVSQPKRFHRLKENPKVKELLREYEVPALFDEPSVLEQLKRGDYKGLVENERIEQLAKDQALEKLIEDLSYQDIHP